MEYEEILSFLDATADKLESSWDVECLGNIANQRVPDFITSGRGTLLRADIHLLWTQWFINSICDSEQFFNSYQGYSHIFTVVQDRIPFIFPSITESERQKITKYIARYIARLIEKEIEIKEDRRRKIDADIKKLLWDLSGSEPRCWICGYKFTDWARNKFLGYSNYKEIPLPRFVDYITLHGVKQRDICIEVDHAIPFAKGGSENIDNLRLSCGWCNSHKSDRLSIYDVEIKPGTLEHPKLGKRSIPHPFWVIRLFSVRQRCEYEGNCEKTVQHSKLNIISKHPQGAMNPANLKVVCEDHDSFGSMRFIDRSIAEKLR
jgi:5-methylcytosine-specific restriction endonuclease McrA